MDSDLSHDAIGELLGAFALDAVDPAEAATVAAHLNECPRCRDEVVEHRKTAAMLAHAGADAPAGIWDSIADQIEQSTTAGALAPEPIRLMSRAGNPGGRRRPGMRAAVAVTAAAATVALAVVGVEVGRLDHRLNQVAATSNSQTVSAAARAALLDPTAQRIDLSASQPGTQPAAEVVLLRSGGAYFFNDRLAPLPRSQAYQLWAMIDGQATSVGLLGSDPTTAGFNLDVAQSTDAFAVTVEPRGGTVAPTRPPIASTSL